MKTIGSQSLDQKFKRAFFLHWEKLVVAAAILGIGAFCWFGYVKPYDKTNPSALLQNVNKARDYIQNADSWTEIASYRKANDQAVEVISAETTVDYQPYQMPRLLGTKAATRGLRTDPEIKNPIEAHAQVVVGPLLIQRPEDSRGVRRRDYWTELVSKRILNKDPDDDLDLADSEMTPGGKGGRLTVKRTTLNKDEIVVVPDIQKIEFSGLSPAKLGLNHEEHTALVVSAVAVTGLFPHELQVKAFEELKGAIKYNELRDQPYYVYLQVERRKRENGQETEWEDITRYVTEDLLKNVYAATAPEIVEEPYVDRYLTVKIPPFVYLDYTNLSSTAKTPVIVEKTTVDDEQLIAPKGQGIPISIRDFNNNPTETVTEEVNVDTNEIPQYKLIRFFDMSAAANEEVQYRFRVWLADPNNPKHQVYDRVWNKNQASGVEGAAAAEEGDEGDMASGGRGGKGAGGQKSNTSNVGNVGNAFDLSFMDVAPGVRKRLKEQEAQPDYPEPIGFLKSARPSEWSEPTEWVHIPLANAEVVAGRVETGLPQSVNGVTYYDDEPLVNVVVKKWDSALQVQIPVARKVRRGSVMNFRSPAKVVNPIDRQLYDVKRELIEEGTEENGVKFATNSFVVDMIGGQKMPYSTLDKTYFEPSEILVMKEDGSLEVRDELGDRMAFRHGTYADDELLTDAAPVVKEAKPETKEDAAPGGRAAGGKGRTP